MKEEVRTDQQLQALLSEYQIVKPELFCDKQKTICRMCVSPQCEKQSLICQEDSCEACGGQSHLHCLNLKLQSISTLLAQRTHKMKDFTIELCKIQNKFITQLHSTRRELIKKYYLGDLEEKDLKVVEEIYKNKNTKCLIGKQAKEFYERLKQSNKDISSNAAVLLDSYQKFIQKVIDEITSIKNKLYECFVQVKSLSLSAKPTQRQVQIDSNTLKHPSFNNIMDFQVYNRLFTTVDNQDQISFLIESLNKPKCIELLYRGSENEFNAAAFHQKCDNVPNTLTIVRTEFDKTIAGFTQYTWNAVKDGWVHNAGKHAFLLSLDLKQKMVPISDRNLIYCHSSYGPTFGVGNDLIIYDQCHNNSGSYANFPYSYNYEGANKYTNNQESYRAFSGATNGNKFRVVEYEVFRVIY